MATFREAIKATLDADGTLATLFPGGSFDAGLLDQNGMTVDNAPREVDGVTLQPFFVIRYREESPFGSFPISAEEGEFELYLYQDTGYAIIDRGVNRVKALLHDTYIECEDRSLAHLIYEQASGELPAKELGYAPSRFIRFRVVFVRS